jgi:hypothetical protein
MGGAPKSQTLPAASVIKPWGPEAACASAIVGKISTRQKSGPVGNSVTVLSATGLLMIDGCCATAAGDKNKPSAMAATRILRFMEQTSDAGCAFGGDWFGYRCSFPAQEASY